MQASSSATTAGYLSTVKLSQFIRSMNWSKNRDNTFISEQTEQIAMAIDLLRKGKDHSLDQAVVNRYISRLETIRATLQTGAANNISFQEATEIADFFKSLPIQ